jgi:hypothetical protein
VLPQAGAIHWYSSLLETPFQSIWVFPSQTVDLYSPRVLKLKGVLLMGLPLGTIYIVTKVSRKTDIEALLKRAETTLKRISSEYDNSLHTKTVSAELRIDIKDYFSNLRSILDYIAHCIVDKYCPEANPRNKLYFPIRADHNGFETEMNKSYPYLISNNKTIYDILESIQPYKKDENKWLTFFNKLNNETSKETQGNGNNVQDGPVDEPKTEQSKLKAKSGKKK